MFKRIYIKKSLTFCIGLVFFANFFYCPSAVAEGLFLPAPGDMVHLSPEYNPPILKGIKIHPDNPFQFDFILDKGDNSPSLLQRGGQGELKIFQLHLTSLPHMVY